MTEASGRHIGKKLSELVYDARVAAAAKIIPAEVAHRAQYHQSVMDEFLAYAQPRLAELLGPAVEAIGTPDLLHDVAGIGADIEHGVGAFFLALVAFIGIGIAGPGAAAAGLLQKMEIASKEQFGDLKLSPPEAAVAVLKGVLDQADAEGQARGAGMHPEVFEKLVEATGEPPGPQELGEALRRGYIDQARFAHGIRQSRIRNEWVDVLTRLRFSPPTAGQVLAGAVQGHLGDADARDRLSQSGIDPSNYQWLYDTAGRPPGAQEMIQLLRRHKVDEATVRQAIRESDIKNKYIDAIIELQHVVPPQRTVVSGLRQGATNDAQAREWLSQLGYPPAAVDMLVAEAHSTKGTAARDISLAETLSLYNEGLIDRGQAHRMLVSLRFNDQAAEELIGLADVQREHRVIAASVARVRGSFVAHKISRRDASVALDTLGMEPASRDHALALWDTERGTNVRQLTEAQVVKAAKAGLIDHGGFVERHQAMGYTPDDAELLWTLDVGSQ